jgi:pilus assembly protein Flp/PilA
MLKLFGALYHLHAKLVAKKEEGATMVEYGLLVALIAIACIAAVKGVGANLSTLFNDVSTNLSNAV